MVRFAIVIALIFQISPLWAKIETQEVKYKVGSKEFVGFLAYDKEVKKKRPGVLVVHEWWGHNEYARNRAKMLAELGYAAFALDMYGDGKTADHPKKAGEFSTAVRKNMPQAEKRFQVAMNELQSHSSVDANRIAAIGYCFGGGIVLEMARRGLDLDAVVSFHGSLATQTPAKKGWVKAKVLVLNGAEDPFVKKEEIQAFKKEMKTAGVDYKFINYPGALHSFTNPGADQVGKKFSLPLAYNKRADQKSWKEMKKLFKRIFRS